MELLRNKREEVKERLASGERTASTIDATAMMLAEDIGAANTLKDLLELNGDTYVAEMETYNEE